MVFRHTRTHTHTHVAFCLAKLTVFIKQLFPLSPSLLQFTIMLSVSMTLSCKWNILGIRSPFPLLISFSKMSSEFILVVAHVRISFLQSKLNVCMLVNLLSTDRQELPPHLSHVHIATACALR